MGVGSAGGALLQGGQSEVSRVGGGHALEYLHYIPRHAEGMLHTCIHNCLQVLIAEICIICNLGMPKPIQYGEGVLQMHMHKCPQVLIAEICTICNLGLPKPIQYGEGASDARAQVCANTFAKIRPYGDLIVSVANSSYLEKQCIRISSSKKIGR